MTVAELLVEATAALAPASDSPRLDAEILLAHIAKVERTALLSESKKKLSGAAISQYKNLVWQRYNHIPVAYLVGRQEFFGLTFAVTPEVLIPRPATELLVAAVRSEVPADSTITFADIGTGSGAIALSLAKHFPQATILASDVSESALNVARWNARQLNLADRVKFFNTSLLAGYGTSGELEKPDFVVANLPYLRPDQLFEPSIQSEPHLALAGGVDGLSLISELLEQISAIKKISSIGLEFDPTQFRSVLTRLKKIRSKNKIKIISDGHHRRGILSTNKLK